METADSAAGLGNVMTRWRARHLPALLRLPLSLAVALLSTPPRLVWLSMCRASAESLVMLDDDGDGGAAVSSLTDHDRNQQ